MSQLGVLGAWTFARDHVGPELYQLVQHGDAEE